ncbi:MobA-like NTP transferase domain-containing protein [Streptomyces sp. DvalAA-14]|uniref:molybdenum cofactor guanylyltransferase n=1 Tax=unclassified Streptomyces TaxID=2593676 RepID=UPI00081BB22F|nr:MULTISPECIES: NTP transferase domain-containing protein [unclassified Streptomyces]SCD29293.1 MobA-like NTP transferase domain-containing protein [Streptomyces sp. DvalAA-14]
MTSYDAVVLAGGAARRLGGADKPALPVGGRMLLDRVLAACGAADATVVVGPRRSTARPVRWTREQPAGGGPLPALAAGLVALGPDAGRAGATRPGDVASSGWGRPEVVLVLAADLPFLTARTVDALAEALTADARKRTGERPDERRAEPRAQRQAERPVGPTVGRRDRLTEGEDKDTKGTEGTGDSGGPEGIKNGDEDVTEWEGVMLTDADGRDQPLAAAYRIEPLRRELALLGAEHGGLTGLPLRLLTGELRMRRMPDPTGEASFDCDTWEDVAVARARLDGASEG